LRQEKAPGKEARGFLLIVLAAKEDGLDERLLKRFYFDAIGWAPA